MTRTVYVYCFRHAEDECQHLGLSPVDTKLSREGVAKLTRTLNELGLPAFDEVAAGTTARTSETAIHIASHSNAGAITTADERFDSKRVGESFQDYFSRVIQAVDDMVTSANGANRRIGIVSHSLALRSILYNAYETLESHSVNIKSLTEEEVKRNIRKPGYARFFVLKYRAGRLVQIINPETKTYRGRPEIQTFPPHRATSVPASCYGRRCFREYSLPKSSSELTLQTG